VPTFYPMPRYFFDIHHDTVHHDLEGEESPTSMPRGKRPRSLEKFFKASTANYVPGMSGGWK
jgi:hypothetical protein